ncbi:MAG: hypothetical protein K6T31_05445, partial [Alicyclobacillus sp.]|nr:hypothetical protein [Alicyclobacillus sp.]
MAVPAWLKRLLTVDDSVVNQSFSLFSAADAGVPDAARPAESSPESVEEGDSKASPAAEQDERSLLRVEPADVAVIRPIRIRDLVRQSQRAADERAAAAAGRMPADIDEVQQVLT